MMAKPALASSLAATWQRDSCACSALAGTPGLASNHSSSSSLQHARAAQVALAGRFTVQLLNELARSRELRHGYVCLTPSKKESHLRRAGCTDVRIPFGLIDRIFAAWPAAGGVAIGAGAVMVAGRAGVVVVVEGVAHLAAKGGRESSTAKMSQGQRQ